MEDKHRSKSVLGDMVSLTAKLPIEMVGCSVTVINRNSRPFVNQMCGVIVLSQLQNGEDG